MQGWGGSYRGGVGHTGVGGSCRHGVGHVMEGCGGSCRGGVCHGWVGCVMEGWGGVCHGGVGWAVNNFLCHKLGFVFSSDKLLSTAFWIMWEKACFCL